MAANYLIAPNGDELYSQNPAPGVSAYVIKANGERRYAKLHNGDERYAIDKDNNSIPITDLNGEGVYAVAADNSQIYPRYFGSEKPLTKKDGSYFLALDKNKNQKYPKTDQGHDNDTYGIALDSNGNPIYPRNKWGNALYPIDNSTGDEMYHFKIASGPNAGSAVYAVDGNGNERYAKRKNQDEFYPEFGNTEHYAYSAGPRLVQYARKADNTVIFRVDSNGDEVYVKTAKGEDSVWITLIQYIDRYAKRQNLSEYYPVINGHEYLFNGKYAVDAQNIPFYPQDENGNEYVLRGTKLTESALYPVGYPTTWDNFVIVSGTFNQVNKPRWFPNTEPKVPLSSLTRFLERGKFMSPDYLSTVVAPARNRPRIAKLAYNTRPVSGDTWQQQCLKPVAIAISLLFLIFFLWCVLKLYVTF